MKPYYITDLSDAAYHARPEVSTHQLMHMLRSPAAFRHAIAHPTAPTPDMVQGKCLHIAALEPERYADAVAVMPEGMIRRGGAWTEFRDGNIGREILTADADAEVKHWRDALLADATIANAMSTSQHEVSLFWTDDDTGIEMRARLDMLRLWRDAGRAIVDDLKTCADASPETMQREIDNRNYDMQAWVYSEAVRHVYGLDDVAFWLDCVEKSEPYQTVRYEIGAEGMAVGRAKYRAALSAYVAARDSGVWEGYKSGVIAPALWTLKRWGL